MGNKLQTDISKINQEHKGWKISWEENPQRNTDLIKAENNHFRDSLTPKLNLKIYFSMSVYLLVMQKQEMISETQRFLWHTKSKKVSI